MAGELWRLALLSGASLHQAAKQTLSKLVPSTQWQSPSALVCYTYWQKLAEQKVSTYSVPNDWLSLQSHPILIFIG